MTELLQRAMEAIEKLPDDVQDAIAARLLAEAADEQAWDEQFGATTDEQWERLISEAHHSFAVEGTTPFDQVFPLSRQE
jgi:hypothetical protein